MPETSFSPISISRSVIPSVLRFLPGRSSSSVARSSWAKRSNSSTSTSSCGTTAARCCLVRMTTLAIPTLPLRRSTSRSSA